MFLNIIHRSFILSLGLMGTLHALVIRHDTPTLDYENYGKDSRFDASTGISRSNDNEYGIAGATAIDSRWGVHARHTLRRVETWMGDGNDANLRGTRWKGWNFQNLGNVRVSEVIHFDDDFTRFANAIDIAIVNTVGKSSTLRIAPLCSAWDEVGRVGSGASAANNRQDGNGNSRKTEAQNTSNSNRWYEVRWAGKNDINQTNGQGLGSPQNALLKIDLDHPTNTSKSTMGGNTAIDLEYGSMNGDSGSPIYLDKNGLNGQVAGVVSGGTGNEYGSTALYVRIRPYVTWITDTVLLNPDNRAVYIATIPDQIVNVGETMTVTESSTGTEQLPLTASFSLVSAPIGVVIDSVTGVITWTPTPAQSGITHTITVRAKEDGVVSNSKDKSFNVTVIGSTSTTFWTWSTAPPNWSAITASGGGGPYNLGNASYPYLQGNTNNMIHQQITGTIPAWATVVVQIKAADFEQTWSNGGDLEYGFRNGQPTVANAADAFLHSAIAAVPEYDSATVVADGLGNTGGNVDYSFAFETTAPLTNPWFAVRKNADGGRLIVDDIHISYYFVDGDSDGLADAQETNLGTNPSLPDTDGDGLNDGVEVSLGTLPLVTDSDLDAFSDGYEVNTLGSNPLDGVDPPGPGNNGIGINFVTSGGLGANVVLPANALAGVPDVAHRNWNQLSAIAFNTTSCTTAQIGSPQAGVIVDSTGTPTSMTMSCSMANLWSADNEKITPYGPLFSGYLDTSGGTPQATVSLSGIPYPEYDVYVYVGAGAAVGRTGRVTDGSTTYSFTTRASAATPGSYVRTTDTGTAYPSASYVLFSGKTSSDLTLTYLRGDSNGGIHAIQVVPVITVSDYEQWAIDNNLDPLTNGAAHFDADKDGTSNLIEFALASNPSDPVSLPTILTEQDAANISITYDKSKLADSALAVAQWSDNLTDWFTTGITETEVIENSTSVTMKAEVPKDLKTARFLRIKVSLP